MKVLRFLLLSDIMHNIVFIILHVIFSYIFYIMIKYNIYCSESINSVILAQNISKPCARCFQMKVVDVFVYPPTLTCLSCRSDESS